MLLHLCCRLWYVSTQISRKGAVAPVQTLNNNSAPIEIGYMNVIPKCLDCSTKYPSYENLPETYAAINAYIADNPLDGKSLSYSIKTWTSEEERIDKHFIVLKRRAPGNKQVTFKSASFRIRVHYADAHVHGQKHSPDIHILFSLGVIYRQKPNNIYVESHC